MRTIHPLRAWLRAATTEEQNLLAERVGTSRGMLWQYAGGHRQASADRAGAIERVTAEMHRSSRGRLPRIYRTDVSSACLQCEYARRCLGERALISEFPIVEDVA